MATNLELVKETRNLAHKMPYSLGTELADALEALIDREKRLVEALEAQTEREKRLVEAAKRTRKSLVAAISLLESGGKKAAASDKIFAIMLSDYRKSADEIRAALEAYRPNGTHS